MDLDAWVRTRAIAIDARLGPHVRRGRLTGPAYEFVVFGLKQAWACLFGGALLVLLVATRLWWPPDAPLARYDALVLMALVLQAALLVTRLERWDEAVVIAVFHVVGTAMEVFKTAHGAWIYPEASVLRIGGVPLFSGFMYAAVGSFIARSFRLMSFRFIRYPPPAAVAILAVGAYANFFTHHFVADIRNLLFAVSAILFGRTWVVFTVDRAPRRMPLAIGFLLVALFIWFAENIGTFAGAWTYPNQHGGWRPAPLAKLGAWYLLMMLSFALVTLTHRPEPVSSAPRTAGRHAGGAWRGVGLRRAPRRAPPRATSGLRSPGSAGAGSGRS